jgi:membrane protein implicated in regulation of membrane protease activity
MLVLGIILLLFVAVVFVGVLLGGGGQPTVDLGALHVSTTTAVIFVAGAATVVLAFLGLWLIAGGARRANKRRRDRKELSRLTKKLEGQQASEPATTAQTQSDEASREAAASGPADTGTTATGTTSGTAPTRPTPGSPEADTGPVTERDQQKP